jgi:glycosyltransferase involved in cell wall biosynthesis
LSDRFVVAYSGNLGRVHDVRSILELAEAVRDDQRIVFAIVGGGAHLAWLKQAVAERKLTHFEFFGAQPRERLARSLGVADLHLVTIRENCSPYIFPSKLYGITAVGRPVLAVCPPACDLARIVTEAGFGAAFAPDDPKGMAQWIRRMAEDAGSLAALAAAARSFHTQSGGCDRALAAWVALLAGAKALADKPLTEKMPTP